MIITVTLKPHHWRIARRDLKTPHCRNFPSSITLPHPHPSLSVSSTERTKTQITEFETQNRNFALRLFNRLTKFYINRESWKKKPKETEREGVTVEKGLLPCDSLSLSLPGLKFKRYILTWKFRLWFWNEVLLFIRKWDNSSRSMNILFFWLATLTTIS